MSSWRYIQLHSGKGTEAAPYLPALIPDLEEAVPGPCRHSHAIIGHPQAADTVVVSSQDTCEKKEVTQAQRCLVSPVWDVARAGQFILMGPRLPLVKSQQCLREQEKHTRKGESSVQWKLN
jgi:hypothetical protein